MADQKHEERIVYKFGDLYISQEEVDYWQGEIKLGRAFRKKYFYDDESESGMAIDCINYYLGKHAILKEGLETPIVDNQIAPIVTVFLSAISHQLPEIIVKMKRTSDIPYQKEITKSVFQYFQEELKAEWHNQQALFYAYVTGLGVKVSGYNSEFDEYDEKYVKKVVQKRRKGLGRGKGTQMIEEEVEQELTRRREWITKEFPVNMSHSPLMTLVDPRSKSSMPYDGKWICMEYELPYNEVSGNPSFENKKDLAPTGVLSLASKFENEWDKWKHGMCRLYQIQIARKDGLYILTLSKDYDKPLRYVKYPFEVEGFLTTFLTLNDTADTFYPPSDIERLIPLQDEVNYIQSRILEAIYKFLPKIGVNSDFFTNEDEMRNVLAKGDLGAILVNKGQATPNQAVQVLNFQLDLKDKIFVLQSLKTEMRLISGVTEAELTGRTDAQTATEANIGQRGSFSRIVFRRERVRRFLKEDLRKFKQICMQACDWELITQITGIKDVDPQTGEMITQRWLRLNSVKDYIKGEYDLDLDMISGQAPNPELKRRQILESVNFLFSPLVEQALARDGMKVDKTLAIKEFLRTMEQFREAENLIIPISPEEKKQLEMMAMMQQGGAGAMATAPQGPPQGDTTSMGELTAQTMGAI